MRAADLIAEWPGPFGGVPPFDRLTPALVEEAVGLAIDRQRAEIAAIVAEPVPPDFANTIEALEDSGRGLRRAEALRYALNATRATDGWPEVEARIAPRLAAFADEIAFNDALFARIAAVYAGRDAFDAECRRLAEVHHNRLACRGAGLAADRRARLTEVNEAIARKQAAFHTNLSAAGTEEPVWVEDAALAGLPEGVRAGAARLAAERGRPGAWAIGNVRMQVWPVLQFADDRELRRRVREMWVGRCATPGPHDNRALAAEIVTLRGEKARALGHRSYAHLATAPRMAGTPEAALEQMLAAWAAVLRTTLERQAELEALAREDGIDGPLRAWDRLYYLERLKRRRFGFDSSALRPYLSLENVLAAVLDAAGRLHGLEFVEHHDLPVIHPDVRVVEARRDGETVGVVWLDLLMREGKQRSSWQSELRPAETFRGRRIPLSNVCCNFERQPDGRVLLGWEYANVLFHELGHALHMILSQARYPSLGPMGIEWDMVELPSQLNERWLHDRALIRRHLRHVDTGEPMPEALMDAVEAIAQFDRVFSVGLEYLAPAIVDMRMYLAADGSRVDPLAIERATYAELGMPEAVDPIFRVPAAYHSFTEAYAAGVYSYFWADVMVADVLEAFAEAPGGLYDAELAERWRSTILAAGSAVPARDAFRAFRGRDPDENALLRRFALA